MTRQDYTTQLRETLRHKIRARYGTAALQLVEMAANGDDVQAWKPLDEPISDEELEVINANAETCCEKGR